MPTNPQMDPQIGAAATARRHVAFDRLHNFRDLGGYPAADGLVVAWGRLYRADSLGKLRGDDASADRERFAALGIRTVVDLRYPWEIAKRGRVPEQDGLDYHNLSIEHRPYDQAALGPDVDVETFLVEKYAEVAADGVKEIRGALDVLAAAAGPAVFHCTSGKDRTGIIGALVLTLLGVDDEVIVADFALTGLATERLVADWRSWVPADRELTWPGYGRAPAGLMRRFLAWAEAEHGSLRGYAEAQLGVDDALVAALRTRYLVAAG
ncbi:tyrosine-protein phosphatase [Yinghuangia sp. YIM S09857]|uniref:tyrosine-protein phosphatase n=1 Tax=Yinghuangia sp. YIM S09857 TaxID=3436929 RepID=UPI003F53BFD2